MEKHRTGKHGKAGVASTSPHQVMWIVTCTAIDKAKCIRLCQQHVCVYACMYVGWQHCRGSEGLCACHCIYQDTCMRCAASPGQPVWTVPMAVASVPLLPVTFQVVRCTIGAISHSALVGTLACHCLHLRTPPALTLRTQAAPAAQGTSPPCRDLQT